MNPEDMTDNSQEEAAKASDFIRSKIEDDLQTGRFDNRVVTRFPPEPNGYLHIGHAKSICLNFGVAAQFDGPCHLRFDDTNPAREDQEFVDSILEDVRWLGFDWGEQEYYASDYYEKFYQYAVQLITQGKAYVCALSSEEMAEYRGVPSAPGKESPSRDRSVAENLDLFARMRDGEFADGEYLLRAKIDMTSPNLHLRDPAIYRIRKVAHHRTGEAWCIYPMYDFAHCISDSIEGITHSLCTLEFEVHRPLYDWILDQLEIYHPQQIEFARLNLTHTLMSKRKLATLVEENHVQGWDDPRMPTISGLRRRGYTAASIRNFCDRIGIAKRENMIELSLLEHFIRQDLEENAPRAMAVLNPLKVVITNFPEGKVDELEALNHPSREEMGKRKVPFTREIYIEREDFREDPPRKFFRLAPGREVRLRYAYLLTCHEVIKDTDGEVVELRCEIDLDSRGGNAPDGRKVKGTIHWVSASEGIPAEVRLYENMFLKEDPEDVAEGESFLDQLNPESLQTITAYVEPSLLDAAAGERFQFERKGYYCIDSNSDKLVINRTVALRDSWAKMEKKQQVR